MATSILQLLLLRSVVLMATVSISGVTLAQDLPAAVPDPTACKIDLAILVDVSGSIVNDRQDELGQSKEKDEEIMKDWYAVTNFTSSIIQRVNVGEDQTHVAIVTFATVVNEIFGLSLYDKSEMLSKVKSLADNLVPDGTTNAYGAVTRARDEIFAIGGPGNRPEVVDVIIMITDGAPTVEYGGNNEILQETNSLKSRGSIIYAVGVGDKVNVTLLELIVSSPNSTHYFPVDDFQGLGEQLESIINQTCQVRPVDDFSVDCSIDLAFLLDSSGSVMDADDRNWDQVIDFTIRMARSYTWNVTDDGDKPRISAITFATEAELSFDLTSLEDEDAYLRALSNITYLGGLTNTAAALRLAYEQIFSAAGGDRAWVQNVIVLITDGVANLEEENLAETVEQLKLLGVHIIVVFIGSEMPPENYVNIASKPEEDFFRVNEFNQISSIYKNVTKQTCEDLNTGCSSSSDLYIVMDASGSIGEKNFQEMKDFVVNFISHIMNSDNVRVGVILFSDDVIPVFSLNTYNTTEDMVKAVQQIRYKRGTTNTAAALRYLRESAFTTATGDRDLVPNQALIITDGNSNNKRETLDEAYWAKGAGITLYTVGIGGWTNVFELQSVASAPYQENYQPISSFSDLDSELRFNLKKYICDYDDPCDDSPCQCGGTCVSSFGSYLCRCPAECIGFNCDQMCKEPTKDIVLALDASGSVGEANFQVQLEIVRILMVLLLNEGMRVALMGYSDNAYVRYHLKDHRTELEALMGVSLYYEGGGTNMSLALQKIHEEVFTVANGDRLTAANIGFLFTDGRPDNREATWREARTARDANIEIFTLGFGPKVKLSELEDIASGPGLSHVIQYPDFVLQYSLAGIIDGICNNVDECTPDFCKNGGTPVDLINRCECRCLPGTSGPDCSRGCGNQYDIILVVDTSGSIRHERFKDLLEFIVELVQQFQVGEDLARFALVYFSNTASVGFHLNSYYSQQDVIAAIRRTPFIGQKTNIADALDMAKADMSTSNRGDREDVINNVIVFTDGQSNMREADTMKSAIVLRSNTGTKVSTVGIGSDTDSLELRGIASEPIDKMATFVTSFNDIIKNKESRALILEEIVNSTCDDTNECSPNPCQNGGECDNDLHSYWCDCQIDWTGRTCARSCSSNLDVTFILDFSGSMDHAFDIVIAFAREVVYGLGNSRVAVVSYDTSGQVNFYLDDYDSKKEILNAMVFSKVRGGKTNTQEALFLTYSDVFRASRGDTQGFKNIAVVVTDGQSNVNQGSTIPRAEEARDNGVEVFVAAVGENPDIGEVNGIASDPDSGHVIAVPDAVSVVSSADALLDKLCQIN